ncbi:MAG: hypothetical protein AAF530_24160 [Pseudomonadota bacterium]
MTNEFIKVNSGNMVPLQNVKRIREVSEEDRKSLSELGEHVDAHKFRTRLEYKDGRRSFAAETLNDYLAQGVELVEIDQGAYVPTQNIISAKDLSPDDRQEIENRMGRPLRDEFCSQVETKAGTVLATIDAAKIMHRMAHPEFAA